MSYQEYYQQADIDSMTTHVHAYEGAYDTLKKAFRHVFPDDQPMTFVLGGFHPLTSTPEAFLHFARSTHPHPEDTHIFLDQNAFPLDQLDNPERLEWLRNEGVETDEKAYQRKIQSPLEALHLRNAVDVMVLDLTLVFMDDETVRRFAENSAEALTQNGIILATLSENLFSRIQQFRTKRYQHEPVHFRSAKKVRSLVKDHLKLVYHGTAKSQNTQERFSIVALARQDSEFLEHTGNEYDIPSKPFLFSQKKQVETDQPV